MASSEDLSSEMGLYDDMFYTSIKVSVDSYPRIKYFQNELQDLFSRFERIYDKLPRSLKLSMNMPCSLRTAVCQLTNCSPMLFLFGSTHSKIHKMDLVKKGKPMEIGTHQLDEMCHLDENEKICKLEVAICTLRMMDTKKGWANLQKVMDCFGVENMFFFNEAHECDKDMVNSHLALLEDALKQIIERRKIVSNKQLSNEISSQMEYKFVHVFQSLNMFLLNITKKRIGTCGSNYGDKGTGGRFYKEIKKHFENSLTVLDVLNSSNGESAEEKLSTAIVTFTKTLLIREIARTYEMQDVQVFEYWQENNYEQVCIQLLKKHLATVPLVRKLYKVIESPNYNLAKCFIQKHYTLADAKTIAKEVTNVFMGFFLQIGQKVQEIKLNLNCLAQLRKELMSLMEETIDRQKYDEDIPKLDKWRKELERIKEIEAIGHVFGKLVVCLRNEKSTDSEVHAHIKRSLRDYPGEVVVQYVASNCFTVSGGGENKAEIAMGDAFHSESGNRGTIGLFMHKDGTKHRDLYFVTSSHIVLGSNVVRTNDLRPVRLGRTRHSLQLEDGPFNIAAVQIERNIRKRCNVFFEDSDGIGKCTVLDMDGIKGLKEGKRVYKRGSATGETRGCIISEDFRITGLDGHNFLVGLPVGVDDATRHKKFAREGDSGAVLYTKTPDGEIQYLAILMGEFILRKTEDILHSEFLNLTAKMGSLILTTCLLEGLNRIEHALKLKLTLPRKEVGK